MLETATDIKDFPVLSRFVSKSARNRNMVTSQVTIYYTVIASCTILFTKSADRSAILALFRICALVTQTLVPLLFGQKVSGVQNHLKM